MGVQRGPMLTGDAPKGAVRTGIVGKDIGTRLTRANFGAALLAAASDRSLIGRMPAVGN